MPNLPTAPIAAAGLIAGFGLADATGNRPLGGAVLAAGGIICTMTWNRKSGPVTAGALLATYIAAFAVSHPLAKHIGAWPSVFAVSAVTAGAAYLASDRRQAITRNSAS